MKKIMIILILFVSSNVLAQSQMDKKSKIAETYVESEMQLAKVYQSVVDIVANENKKTLVKAQNDWLKYRESECKFEISDIKDETEKAKIKENCLFEINKKRIHELQASYIILRLQL